MKHHAALAALLLALGCHMPEYDTFVEQQEKFASESGATSVDPEATTSGISPTSSGAIGSDGADASAGDTSGAPDTGTSPPGSATDTGDTTDSDDAPPLDNPDQPSIVSIELPANVYAAGPVPLAVQTEHTGSVRVTLDGVDAGELVAAGSGVFTGVLPVHGAIDNGWHDVEILAKQGPYEATRDAGYTVSTPAPGTEAWSQTGPEGSRTNRVVVTSEGDSIEGGQTETNGVARPTIRKRSGITGAEVWPEGTITLDEREGSVVDVAVLPDGRMWVAMNVRPPAKDQRPRIALLDADGHALGVEVEGPLGRAVRAIAADADGGCFAVGVAGVMGDWDIAYWRINGEGVQTLGDAYDYVPGPNDLPHKFLDLASDVVIDGDLAWIVGISKGNHDDEMNVNSDYLRGIIIPMNLNTGEIVGSVSSAPASMDWPQSAFFGAALHPEGLLVTGYGCDESCAKYRLETSLYGVEGERAWFVHETSNTGLAYGSDVVLDSQGRALVAGAVTQNGKLRGYMFARQVHEPGPILFQHWYPGISPSEGLGIAVDGFDRIFPAGYITANGATLAHLMLLHG